MKKKLKVLLFVFVIIPLMFIAIGAFFSEPETKYDNQTLKYAKTSLNVRKYPKIDAKILKILSPNEKVIVYDSIVNGFILILNSDSTKYGWASKNYIQSKKLSNSQLLKFQKQQGKKVVELVKKRKEKVKEAKTKTVKWYMGGTLHKSKISDWKSATEQNKIATCADYITAITGSKSLTDIKIKATELKKCIDVSTKGLPSTDNLKVTEIASDCIILLGYN